MVFDKIRKAYKKQQLKNLQRRQENLKILKVKANISEQEYKLKKRINKGKKSSALGGLTSFANDFTSSERNKKRMEFLK